MILFGFGKITKKVLGEVVQKTCPNCNATELWQLCVMRTWFTLFFIPIIPYKSSYCITCPKCGAYIQLTKEQFTQLCLDLLNSDKSEPNINFEGLEDVNSKYRGKNETQINYLKEMESYRNNLK